MRRMTWQAILKAARHEMHSIREVSKADIHRGRVDSWRASGSQRCGKKDRKKKEGKKGGKEKSKQEKRNVAKEGARTFKFHLAPSDPKELTPFFFFFPRTAWRWNGKPEASGSLRVSLRGKNFLNFMGGAWCVRKEREGRGKTEWCVCWEFKAGWVYSLLHSQITPEPCVQTISGTFCLHLQLRS